VKREEPGDDAAWRAIVENYGEPVLRDEDLEAEPPRRAQPEPESYDDEPDPFDDDPDDRFIPPAPPPLPRPTPDRLVAWLGVFLAPALLLACVVAGYQPPRIIGWLLVAWFVGGFLYLVVRMPAAPRDPWDDGATL
jgi:hypothetical protein